MSPRWADAALALSSGNKQPVLRGRKRIAPLSCEVPVDLVSDILHHDERTHGLGPCTSSHARRSHRPAVRRLHLEGTHEPITITQHPLPHPLVGPPSVIIKVTRRACAVSSASAHETRRWKFRRYTHELAADQ